MKLVHIIAALGLFANSTLVLSQTPLVDFIEAPTGLGQCVDSEPFGDNFGWNGVCSCVIEPVSGFGSSISMDNGFAAIGSNQSPDGCVGSGSVSIFEYSQGEWTRQAELVSSGRTVDDEFPNNVSISNDSMIANTRAINNENGIGRISIFTIFNRTNGNWSESQQLRVENSLRHFSHDSNTLVVGSNEELLIFSKQPDGMWRQSAEIDHIGSETIFEVFEDTLVMGSTVTNVLSIYRNTGTSWQIQGEFPVAEGAIQSFTGSLDINSDTIVFTPDQLYSNGIAIFPSAYTFQRNEEGNWIQTNGVVAPEIILDNGFGPMPVRHFPDTYLAPDDNLMLYMRDTFFSDPSVGTGFSVRNPDLLMYQLIDGQWRLADMTTFTQESGFSYETGFSAAFNGSNILLGTQNENTVLALSVDATGALITDPSNNVDNETNPDNEANSGNDIDTDDNSESGNESVSELESENIAESDNGNGIAPVDGNSNEVASVTDDVADNQADSGDEVVSSSGGGSVSIITLLFGMSLLRRARRKYVGLSL